MNTAPGLTWVSGTHTPIKVYITRVLNYGTLEELRALKDEVTKEDLREAIEHPLRGQWTPRGKAFVECIFDRRLPDDVLISYA